MTTYDVVVVGSGPAACAAALALRGHGCACALLGRREPDVARRLDWLGPAGISLCEALGLSRDDAGGARVGAVKLRSWDLGSEVDVRAKDLSGWVVPRAALDVRLREAAGAAGATVLTEQPVHVALAEDCAELRVEGADAIRGRLLLIAEGLDSPTAALARMATARGVEGVATRLEVSWEAKGVEAGLELVLGARRAPEIVTLLRGGGLVTAALITRAESAAARGRLEEFVAAGRQAGVLPAGGDFEVVESRSPTGAALEMDSHVGKRCLVLGEAGGFVAAFSDEMLYPAMKSGQLAAEAAVRALKADVLQDELQTFSSAWRAELAEYLRLPNTDLALLVPLVFNNMQMSERIARAFLLGQGF